MRLENLRFAAIQWWYWSAFGLLFTFLVAYLEYLHYSGVQIGFVMGAVSGAAMLGQPFWGIVVDRTDRIGTVVLLLLLVSAVMALPLFLAGARLVWITLFAALVSFTLQALAPIIDAWTMHYRALVPGVNYGLSRAVGSVGFAVTVAIAGRLYDRFGLRLMFPAYAVAALIAAVFVAVNGRAYRAAMRRIAPAHGAQRARPTASVAQSLHQLLRPQVGVFLIICLAAFSAFRAAQIFLPLLISEVGGTNTDLGFALSVMAISEVPFLVLFALVLRRLRDTDVVLIALALFVVRIATHVFAATPAFVIAIQALQGISFGLFLPASVHYMNRVAPPGTKTLAQTVAAVCTFGLGSTVGSAAGGYLVERLGVRGMYTVASIVMILTVAAYFVLFYRPGVVRA